ncbi:metallophosphoesterase [Pelomonas sp. HMWF004]|nr:metallophosphoesterase [Pelomonas sp. HMWF004]
MKLDSHIAKTVFHLFGRHALRLLVLSDPHLEICATLQLPGNLNFDVTVLAGDIHSPGREAVTWAQTAPVIGERPTVLVAGNHEFYGSTLSKELAAMKQAATGSLVHVLDRQAVVIAGVRFLGCTLWTDFQLPFSTEARTDIGQALHQANAGLADYQRIALIAPAVRAARHREFVRLLRAEDTLAMHWVDRDWLRRELQAPFDGPTVVVTHHAPLAMSVGPLYIGDRLSPAFASDLPTELFGVPTLWIHGHTHHSADYTQRRCRVLSNPRGYPVRGGRFENASFSAGLVVEVPTQASCHG